MTLKLHSIKESNLAQCSYHGSNSVAWEPQI